MVSKVRINNFKSIRIDYNTKVYIDDINFDYLTKLKKSDLIHLMDKFINNYEWLMNELEEAYKEITNFREEVRMTKYKTTKSENKLVEVLLDYHLATRKLLK